MSVWVHLDGWAGRVKLRGELVKRNARRSRVRLLDSAYGRSGLVLVPNHAITERA